MKHKKKALLITLFILLIISSTYYFFYAPPKYHIIDIDSFNQAQTTIDHCDSQILITFDVDDTLITTHDPLLITLNYPLLFTIRTLITYPKLLHKNNFELIASIVFSHAHFFLTEKSIVSTIQQLQKNGCHIIGLTSIETGSFGTIPSFEEWRAHMLHDFGINFENEFNRNVVLDNLPSYRGNHPHFYKGILCTNQEPKGATLQALLEKIPCAPKRIISFDDDLNALESIAHTCARLNIPFTGYRYQGAKKLKPVWDMNQALAELNDVMQDSKNMLLLKK